MDNRKNSQLPKSSLTNELKNLINHSFSARDAMNLIRRGADPNTKTAQGASLLHLLSHPSSNSNGENDAAIKELVETYHADIHVVNGAGYTALQALFSGHGTFRRNAAMLLVRLGANPNTTTANGTPLLHLLVSQSNNRDGKNDNAIKELVEIYHADINMPNAALHTPLEALLRKGSFRVQSAMILVRLGANPNTKAAEGSPLLHLLTNYNIGGRNDAAIRELVQIHHVDINSRNTAGQTTLQALMQNNFRFETAMLLVSLGADPNTRTVTGRPLLHILSSQGNNYDGRHDEKISKLIELYQADIDITNRSGQTAMQALLSGTFRRDSAVNLIRLGANPDTKAGNGKTLFELLKNPKTNSDGKNEAILEELLTLAIRYDKTKHHTPRNDFLNFLLYLVLDRKREDSASFFKNLPLELVFHIISFLDFKAMGRTWKEGIALTSAMFEKASIIKEMAASPGGINVFQRNNKETHEVNFTLFKSVETLANDYETLKAELRDNQSLFSKIKRKMIPKSSKELTAFMKNYAVKFWDEHAQLYQKERNRQHLFNRIKDTELFKKPKLRKQLKLK